MGDLEAFEPLVLHVRSLLQERGFRYCDADDKEFARNKATWLKQQSKAQLLCQQFSNVLAEGIEASTTDHEQQSIANTLDDDRNFWSSTGSVSTDIQDTLLYRLKGPLCRVTAVKLAVYRARYQFGEPLYPPQQISFEIGATPWCLRSVCAPQPVRITNMLQTFVLPVDTVIGGYLKVLLHGRCQRQLDDMQYYTAIRYVTAVGTVLDPVDQLHVCRTVAQPGVHLVEGAGVPATQVLTVKAELDQQTSSSNGAARPTPVSRLDALLGWVPWPRALRRDEPKDVALTSPTPEQPDGQPPGAAAPCASEGRQNDQSTGALDGPSRDPDVLLKDREALAGQEGHHGQGKSSWGLQSGVEAGRADWMTWHSVDIGCDEYSNTEGLKYS